MKKLIQILKCTVLITFVAVLVTSCKSENQTRNENRFEKMNAEERAQAFDEIKQKNVDRLICNIFKEEIYNYVSDVKRKELKINNEYFFDYPHQFQMVKNFYGSWISTDLQNEGVSEYGDASIKNMEAPDIETLPCQKEILTWNQKRNEWDNLKDVLPTEYSYEESWTYKLNEALEWLKDKITDLLFTLFFVALLIYAFVLHYGFIVQKNNEGLWLLLVTPISAIPIQKFIKAFLPFENSFWERLSLTSLLISLIFSVVLIIYSRSIKNK
jgi:hypothetical protein